MGNLEPVVERTLGLYGIFAHDFLQWEGLHCEVDDPCCTCVIACLVIPGKADAGGVMSTTALDDQDIGACLSLNHSSKSSGGSS